MKFYLSFLFVVLVAVSCNNNPEKVVEKVTTGSAQEAEMKAAIAKYPDSLLLKETLIQYYEDNDNIDLALTQTNILLQKDSNNVRFWNKKADLLFLNEDTLAAIKAYEKSIDLYPDPKMIMSLGALYAQTKNPNAIALADALLIGKNAHAEKEAFLIKGIYYSYTNDKIKAIPFFDKSLALDYTFMPAYLEKGVALYELAKYNEALLVFDKAIAVQNSYDEGYYWMGKCFEKLNKKTEAIESYKSALLYDPNFIEAQDALAKLGIKN